MNVRVLPAIAGLCLWFGLMAPAATAATISEGGVSWFVQDLGTRGLGVQDATFLSTAQGDAYDDGLIMRVNGSVLTPVLISPITNANGTTVTSGAFSLSGLNVTTQYFFQATSPTARTISVFQNPSASPIAVTITFETNVGSDGGTNVISTSSGDTLFTNADRWIVTDDSTTAGDPANTHVLFGPGSVLSPSNAFLTTTFSSAGDQGVRDDFALTVPGGSTVALMFFNELRATAADAELWAAVFDDTAIMATLGFLEDLPAGITPQQIVNWNLAAAAPTPEASVPEPSSMALTGVAALCLVSFALMRRRVAR